MTLNDRELSLRPEDVRAAQAVLDAWDIDEWVTLAGPVAARMFAGKLLELRGIVAVQLSDVRAAGYLEGLQVGRREAGQLMVECLRGEGLA